MRLSVSRGLMVGGVALVGIASAILLVIRLISQSVTDSYSSGWVSNSLAEARDRGVLVTEPEIACPTVSWHGRQYPVREIWTEQAVRIERRWLFVPRIVPLGTHRLVVKLGSPPGLPPEEDLSYAAMGGPQLVYNDSVTVSSRQGQIWYASVVEPFPRTVCVSVAA